MSDTKPDTPTPRMDAVATKHLAAIDATAEGTSARGAAIFAALSELAAEGCRIECALSAAEAALAQNPNRAAEKMTQEENDYLRSELKTALASRAGLVEALREFVRIDDEDVTGLMCDNASDLVLALEAARRALASAETPEVPTQDKAETVPDAYALALIDAAMKDTREPVTLYALDCARAEILRLAATPAVREPKNG